MVSFFLESNLRALQESLGVFERDIKRATKTASRVAFRWAAREAAKLLAKEAQIPYQAARIRVKSRGGINSNGVVWFGLNAISAKYLGAKYRRDTFTASKLQGHRFERVGKARYPIRKVEKEIEAEGMELVEGEFRNEIEQKLINEFFNALDKGTGRAEGTSKIIAGL